MSNPLESIDWKKAFGLLARANNWGIRITEADGHWWIWDDSEESYGYKSVLQRQGITVNNKIYGGIFEALAVIDKSLKMAGVEEGLDGYSFEFMGHFEVDGSRISQVPKNKGGLS